MSMPPHGGGPRYPLPSPHHHPLHHHMMGAPPPPGYAMMGPAHPHHMPPFPSKHNSLLRVRTYKCLIIIILIMCYYVMY